MRARSLSGRLTIVSIAAVALAVVLFGAAAKLVVEERLEGSLDDSLRQRGTDVARLAVSAPALLRSAGALEAPVSGRQLSVEVLDREGAIVARSLSLGARLLPRGAAVESAEAGTTAFEDTELGDEHLRLFAAPIAEVGGPAAGGVVLVASSTDDVEETQRKLGLLLLVCGAGAVLAGGIAAALLTRRSTRPLRDLSSSAATIERTEDPSARLAEPAGPAEIAELASTLNRMLGSLEASRERERRFLADASHELRTPLTSLRGNVEYVGRHGLDPETLADLEADAERLRRLVDDLLELERQAAGAGATGRELALDELVREAAAGRAAVTVAIEGPASVVGDADALARALSNLLDNAERHGPPGGSVELALARRDGRAAISVTDAGEGFAPGTEEAAFERFWRGPDATGSPGSGLGLAIVRATAERHNGLAFAKGSTVTVELPLA